jgi:AcrR family transcriptional regulator
LLILVSSEPAVIVRAYDIRLEGAVPKRVDREERRGEIAAAVARLAATKGLASVSFREVAAEAGMSVANVQHYFGSKHDMLIGALDRQSATIGTRIVEHLDALGPSATPLDQIRTIVTAFIPTDETSTAAMRVYHSFAGAAVADPTLRTTEAFANGRAVIATLADRLTQAALAGEVRPEIDPDRDAAKLLALVLGLSLCVLLDQMEADDASATLDSHLRSLTEHRPGLR